MPFEPTLDLDRLSAPISEDRPAGSYLKETDYVRLQNAKDQRAKAVAAERKEREMMLYSEEDLDMIPEQDRQVDPPDWRSVRDSCVDILANHSKDLWVSSWLVEANTRLAGFAGMRDSFRLTDQIARQYWSDINPPPDEEGYLGTVSQLTSLNGEDAPGTLMIAIDEAPLIPGRDEFTCAAYRQATKGSGGSVTEGEFLTAARSCESDSLRMHGQDIEEAIEAHTAMTRTLEEQCGEVDGMPVAPPSTQILNALVECKRVFQLITRDVLAGGDEDEESEETAAGGAVSVAQSQVNNREDAFRLLLKASEFFRRTEPHSPVSSMLQEAVRFGRMDLAGMMQELINDEDALTRFAERTGIKIDQSRNDE